MALTILERPTGVILGTCVSATINESYNGFATVNRTTHDLVDGQWIYITCDVENYNGFYQVDKLNDDQFAIRQYDGTYLPFVVSADITYCPGIQTHKVSCVHLPITYRILNNKYPVNSVDTARTITSLADNSGFAQLGLSGTLGTFEDLQFVKISGSPDSTLDGIYQIIDKLSTTSVILNIDYTTVTNATLLGATMQLYYGNYNVVVRVYAGINSGHEWASEKPYELATTLELIPDDNNQVFFSINEILKAYVKTENNLLVATMPNNIDAWTNFYISTAEAYDTSNGYTVSTLETGFTSDQSTFEGTAVNAELVFKNIHSGYMSDYIMNYGTAKFLTLFTTPVIFSCGTLTPDCYQDISFINVNENADTTIRLQYYLNGVSGATDSIPLGIIDQGVIRVPLEVSCSYDRVDIYVEINSSIVSETKSFDIDCGCSDQEIRLTWINNLGGFDYWVFTAQTEHAIDITEAQETKKNIFPNWPNSYGDKADTIRKQTVRKSVIKQFVTSQHLTQAQADGVAYIKSSPLVQIINSRQDRRTVILDTDSFVKYVDGDKLFTISFNITYTNDIPSQKL